MKNTETLNVLARINDRHAKLAEEYARRKRTQESLARGMEARRAKAAKEKAREARIAARG